MTKKTLTKKGRVVFSLGSNMQGKRGGENTYLSHNGCRDREGKKGSHLSTWSPVLGGRGACSNLPGIIS